MDARGAYMIFAPWGDTMHASMTGTSAVMMGADSPAWFAQAAQQSPEQAPFTEMIFAAGDLARQTRGTADCEGRCKNNVARFIPGWNHAACVKACEGQELERKYCVVRGPAGVCFVDTNTLWLLIGAGVVIVGAAALVK